MANPKASPVSVPRVKDKHFDVPIFRMLVLRKKDKDCVCRDIPIETYFSNCSSQICKQSTVTIY